MNLPKTLSKRPEHNGRLSLGFEKRRGKTLMTKCYQEAPLKASRVLYMNPNNRDEATVYMMESSGGLVAGDHNDFEVDIQAGANVGLIPQSATKIYPSYNGEWSSQNINVSIESGATLAWHTEALIPYVDAKFRGETVIKMAKDASLLWGDVLSPGRDKSGEVFDYEHVRMNFQVWLEDECLIYDPFLFSPNNIDLKQLGHLEGHTYVGSMWFVSPEAKHVDVKELNDKLQKISDVRVGVSQLEDKAVNFRWLASDNVLLKKEMDNIWQLLAKNLY